MDTFQADAHFPFLFISSYFSYVHNTIHSFHVIIKMSLR